MYPNPTSEQLSIRLQGETIETVEIYSVTGSVVLKQSEINALNSHKLDVSAISAGIYFIKVNDSKAQKLIIR
ncbi:MAG: T9SS type A sorting domain-containing protein, partial [Flavobacteriaceae bacterium]|nr:T9SS type A sorting domain-containing protein [Flavobacteriaceae bacterium]